MPKEIKIKVPKGASKRDIEKLVSEKLLEIETKAKYKVGKVVITCEDKGNGNGGDDKKKKTK
jgi:hypothetical protein